MIMTENNKFKKGLEFLTVLLILVVTFSSCKEEHVKQVSATGVGRHEVSETEFVSMSVLPEKLFTDSSVKITLVNSSQGELFYDTVFVLEYLDDKTWTPIPLDILFEDISLILEAGEIYEEELMLSELDCNRLGKYRIVKKFGLFTYPDFLFSVFSLSAEFEIR